jgi:hypothetical protein
MAKYGVSEKSVRESKWVVVEAMNSLDEFIIEYPDSEEAQLKLACKFQGVSEVKFSNCAGAIDGILIWILKSLEEDAAAAGCGRRKFFCGRKGKFGLNCQTVSDVRGRILDFSIGFPGTSSDCIVFEVSNLYERLEGGLLNKGLVCLMTMCILARVTCQHHFQTFHQVPRMILITFILRFVFKLSAHLDNLFQGGEL